MKLLGRESVALVAATGEREGCCMGESLGDTNSKESLITLKLHLGGKFVSQNVYMGGKIENVEIDYSDFHFEELIKECETLGYYTATLFAFRDINKSGNFVYFYDSESIDDVILSHIDYEKKLLEIYVENEKKVDVDSDGNFEDLCDDGLNDEFIKPFKGTKPNRKTRTITQSSIESMNFYANSETHRDIEEDYNTEYASSDNSVASLDSDEDVDFIRVKKKKTPDVYDDKCNISNLELALGMRFKDCNECKDVVRSWSIKNGYSIKWKKSGCAKLQAICEENCPWMLYASKIVGEPTCIIKTYVGEHSCCRVDKNRQVNSAWLAKVIMPVLKVHPNYSVKDMVRDVRLTYDTVVEESKCYRAKEKALTMLRGTFKEHYSRIRSYILELRRIDSEGRFELMTSLNSKEEPVFKRIYIGFSSLKKGFSIGCGKTISFDGCFLKTKLSGVLLTAVSRDCNNKMYPISWAVVEKENEETWTWFFEKLFQELGISDGFGWTFMSDKQKGLINGIQKLAPNAEHRHCARHIYANWKKKFPGPKFKVLFWSIVKSNCESQFRLRLNDLKEESVLAYEDFLAQQPQAFCKSLVLSLTKSDLLDNNICESFNSYILKSREMMLIDMLEDLRRHLMTRAVEILKMLTSSQDRLCPNIRKKIAKIQGLVKFCTRKPAIGRKYEVTLFDEFHIVDLENRSCTCRFWELTGITCCHGMACILHVRENPDTYVDAFFYLSNGIEAYKYGLPPAVGPDDWPISNEPHVLPPEFVNLPGRPKKLWKRDQYEELTLPRVNLSLKGLKMTCSKCDKFDHNKRSCKYEGPSIEKKPKGKVGRPRKNIERPLSIKRPSTRTTVTSRERRMASQGYGVRYFPETGNVFTRDIGEKSAHFAYQGASKDVGRSQSSQIID